MIDYKTIVMNWWEHGGETALPETLISALNYAAAKEAEAQPHVAVISPPEAQAILANPKATKEEIERAHAMTYEIPCEHQKHKP